METWLKHGLGKNVYANGETYVGAWRNDKRHGKGKFITAAMTQEAMWENNIPQNPSKYIFPNGDSYEGVLRDGKVDGQGKKTDAQGNISEGNFVNGSLNGYGTVRYVSGDFYEGIWKDGRLNGQGKMTKANGDIFEGNFVNDELQGYGKAWFASGDCYEGTWFNGEISGFGTYTHKNGGYTRGNFINGKRDGFCKVVCTADESKVYEGHWKNDEKEGYWMAIYWKFFLVGVSRMEKWGYLPMIWVNKYAPSTI